MNTLAKTINTSELSIEFLRSLNGLMNLTNRELYILSIMLDIQMEIDKKKLKVNVDSAQNRKIIMSMSGVTRDNLSRYIKKYKNRGILVYNNKLLSINKVLVPYIIGGKSVQIVMVLKIKSDDSL